MGILRSVLRRTGLMPAARRVRDLSKAGAFFRRNMRYWGHPSPDGQPLPPIRLIQLVSGEPDIEWFLEGGRRAAEAIRAALQRQGIELDRLGSILDFGCGCGRVVRRWLSLRTSVHGCDYNPDLIDWCRSHLEFASFEVNRLDPPLPYPDAHFDLVYSLSVFTHLPEELQRPWIVELARVLRPGGTLILTTHGAHYRSELSAPESDTFDAGRLVVRHGDEAGENICGAYHPEAYIRTQLSRGLFEILEGVPEGAAGNPYQDLWVLGRVRSQQGQAGGEAQSIER